MSARIEALAAERAVAVAARLGDGVRDAFPELEVAIEPDRVVVRGRGLGRRMLGEPRLRWLGGLLR